MIKIIVGSEEEAAYLRENLTILGDRVRMDYKLINSGEADTLDVIISKMINNIYQASDLGIPTIEEPMSELKGCHERCYSGPMPLDGSLKD